MPAADLVRLLGGRLVWSHVRSQPGILLPTPVLPHLLAQHRRMSARCHVEYSEALELATARPGIDDMAWARATPTTSAAYIL